jgi:phage-related protein
MNVVLEKPEHPRKLVWLVDSLDRLTGFPPAVRQKLGFALYQAQIGQKHESAKMLHGFAETFGRCVQTIRAGRIVRCTSHNSGTRFTWFMPSRRRRLQESRLRNEN